MKEKLNMIAKRANELLGALSLTISEAKREFNTEKYTQTFTKNAVTKLPGLSRPVVDKAIAEMESVGFQFSKKKTGSTESYAMTPEEVIKIYEHRGQSKYRDEFENALTVFASNLKGGVSKTVSLVTLAHGLRSTPALLRHDLRILVLDLDPQASATMFLKQELSIGNVENTAAQAMFQNLSREELINDFVVETSIKGVDVIPASLEDGFIASQFNSLVEEHLPGQKPYDVLKKNVIDKLSKDYDFIFIDSGPHLDAFLLNSFVAADVVITPVPPAQVDYHSTLKYLSRITDIFNLIEQAGSKVDLLSFFVFMSKARKREEHLSVESDLKEIAGSSLLSTNLPSLSAYERTGESFDTVFSANPLYYPGDRKALSNARAASERFVRDFFDRVNFERSAEGK